VLPWLLAQRNRNHMPCTFCCVCVLSMQSEGMLLWLRAYGELKSYSPGQCIVPRRVSRLLTQ
jgi:hypothetical protein